MIQNTYLGHEKSLEDFWVGMQDNFEVRKIKFCRLTVFQMRGFGIKEDIPKEFCSGIILDPIYDTQKIDQRPLSLIIWSKPKGTKINNVTVEVAHKSK